MAGKANAGKGKFRQIDMNAMKLDAPRVEVDPYVPEREQEPVTER